MHAAAVLKWFWVWQSCKTVVLLVVTLKIKRKRSQALYLCDFCWIATWMKDALALLMLLTHARLLGPGRVHSYVLALANSAWLFRGLFALAVGPLGWSVVTVGNALMFHSLEMHAALLIHLSPPMTAWALRWHSAAHTATFPGLFLGLPQSEAEAASVTLREFYAPAVIMYMCWWAVYTPWLLLYDRHQSISLSGHDTVYSNTMVSNPAIAKALCGYDDSKPTAVRPAFVYMLIHMMASLFVLLPPSYLMWRSFVAHTAFGVALLIAAAWNGASRYEYMLVKKNVKVLKAVVERYEEAAAAEGGGVEALSPPVARPRAVHAKRG